MVKVSQQLNNGEWRRRTGMPGGVDGEKMAAVGTARKKKVCGQWMVLPELEGKRKVARKGWRGKVGEFE